MSTLDLNPEPEQAPIVNDNSDLIEQARSGANWFYWIAALSLVNSAIFLFGGQWSFFAGLGVTQVVDAFGQGIVNAGVPGLFKIVPLGIDLVIAGMFGLFGMWAGKFHSWAFIAGMVLYLLDALLVLMFGEIFMAAFHGFVLFMIFRGFQAARQIRTA